MTKKVRLSLGLMELYCVVDGLNVLKESSYQGTLEDAEEIELEAINKLILRAEKKIEEVDSE